ncbi:hypothetical protein F5878DRAFT_652030 [Lentinula raphanica]|uniref:CxC2-like cysteine cluster KDZ transposase-associated domain-containing protein n=1 Tax=Lentinula raphanica TaxID=153919 RepID=A0AA38UE72_9AGAR|nr:hypothetical protein C8R42DRAFT_582476 [Lentinula raphanica]KAJ3838497.1 hypothetical protein F5878DRAFT_652030 [Lentinula raphanica]
MQCCNLANAPIVHRRGRYFAKSFGISFGGGQAHPANFSQTKTDEKAWNQFRSTPETQKLARRVDYLLKYHYPRLHSLYTNVLADLCESDVDLQPNFDGCCFAASTLNFERAVSIPHRDSKNLTCGECGGVHSEGSFDYRKDGHLILWDLRLIIKLPPGCTALLPSALLRHFNTTIHCKETRYSMTFYIASGLFRWRHNKTKTFFLGPQEQLAEWNDHRDNPWKTGLDLLRSL